MENGDPPSHQELFLTPFCINKKGTLQKRQVFLLQHPPDE